MTRELQPSDYQHTRVLGFSVTRSIWDAFYAAIPNPSNWELVWYSGGSVDIWADPNSHAWTSRDLGGAFLNPAASGGTGGLINGISDSQDPTVGTGSIDRVILNVSGLCTTAADPVLAGYNGGARPSLGLTPYDTTGFTATDPTYKNGYVNVTEYWRLYTNAAIANIRSKYPNARMILLQPNIGGPSGSQTSCTTADANASQAGVVRCTYTAPYVYTVCAALERANVRMGFVHYANNCTDFSDWAGHLDVTPQTTHGQAMASYYASNL